MIRRKESLKLAERIYERVISKLILEDDDLDLGPTLRVNAASEAIKAADHFYDLMDDTKFEEKTIWLKKTTKQKSSTR